jgi:hypothetical protein
MHATWHHPPSLYISLLFLSHRNTACTSPTHLKNSFEFSFQTLSPIYTLLLLSFQISAKKSSNMASISLSHAYENANLATVTYLSHLVGGSSGKPTLENLAKISSLSLSLYPLLKSTPNQLLPPSPAMHYDPTSQ